MKVIRGQTLGHRQHWNRKNSCKQSWRCILHPITMKLNQNDDLDIFLLCFILEIFRLFGLQPWKRARQNHDMTWEHTHASVKNWQSEFFYSLYSIEIRSTAGCFILMYTLIYSVYRRARHSCMQKSFIFTDAKTLSRFAFLRVFKRKLLWPFIAHPSTSETGAILMTG